MSKIKRDKFKSKEGQIRAMPALRKYEDGIMRGYQKRVVYLKNTGSPVFEEAYFVIRADNKNRSEKSYTGEALIEEANRIIEENVKMQNGKKRKISGIRGILVFCVGFLSAALLSTLIFIIL